MDLVLQLRGSGTDTGRRTGFQHGTRSAVDDVLLGLVDEVKGSQWVVGRSLKLAFYPKKDTFSLHCVIRIVSELSPA